MQEFGLKVSELAKQTGVSVRTLHYYDQIGLLCPARRTETGYRLYADAEILRLQQIVSLRQIGFSLEQIRECLAQPQFSPQQTIQLHLARLEEQMELQQQLYTRLQAIGDRLQSSETISIQEFITLIEAIMTVENYYTPEQLENLRSRRQMLGEERIHQAEAEWQELISQAKAALQNGLDPASESVQALARRWQELIQEFTGGDAGIERSLNQMYQQEGAETASRGAIDSAVMEYMSLARVTLARSE